MQKVTVIRTVLNDQNPSKNIHEALILKNDLQQLARMAGCRTISFKVEACDCDYLPHVHYSVVMEEEIASVRHFDPDFSLPGSLDECFSSIRNMLLNRR